MKQFALVTIFLFLSAGIVAQQKTPEPLAVKIPFERSLQAVVVTTKDWASMTGVARLIERRDLRSDWKAVGDSFPVVLGSGGMSWGEAPARASKFKKEGDNSSPAGVFPITAAFGSATKPEALELPYTKLDHFTECVNDSRSRFYNRVVNRMHVGSFDWKTSQKLAGEQFALGLFVGFNSFPVVRDRGSCLLMHVWSNPTASTAGSTAMERRNMERVAGWVSREKNPYLIQMPLSEYDRLRKTWKLPKIK